MRNSTGLVGECEDYDVEEDPSGFIGRDLADRLYGKYGNRVFKTSLEDLEEERDKVAELYLLPESTHLN